MPTDQDERNQLSKNPLAYWKQKLPGMGGVFNSPNMAMFTYGHQNPVKLVDPDGELVILSSVSLTKGAVEGSTYAEGSGFMFDTDTGDIYTFDFKMEGNGAFFGVSGSGTIDLGISLTNTFDDIKDSSLVIGGSGGTPPLTIGVDYTSPINDNKNKNGTLTISVGGGGPTGELHIFNVKTNVENIKSKGNPIRDFVRAFTHGLLDIPTN